MVALSLSEQQTDCNVYDMMAGLMSRWVDCPRTFYPPHRQSLARSDMSLLSTLTAMSGTDTQGAGLSSASERLVRILWIRHGEVCCLDLSLSSRVPGLTAPRLALMLADRR